ASPRIGPFYATLRTANCPYTPPLSTLTGAGIPLAKKHRRWPRRHTFQRVLTNSSDEFWRWWANNRTPPTTSQGGFVFMLRRCSCSSRLELNRQQFTTIGCRII